MSSAKYPAQNLAAVAQAIEPQPLMTEEEIRTLYRPEVNVVRGEDIVRRMKIELEDSYFSTYYKAFVMGHSGVGKSTEMSRLILDLESKYEAIRFSATENLSPGSFEPFDVVLLMVMQLIEQAAKPEADGGLAFSAPDYLLRPLFDWLAEKTDTVVTNRDQQVEAAGGVGVASDSLFAKALALFVNLKGEIRFAASRRKEQVEYQLRRLSELLRITNRILGEYRRVLREKRQKEWLFLGEDFDKAGVSPALIEKLFLTYGNIFSELDCHLIFSIPATLVYSQAGSQLPVGHDRVLVIPDTPVFDQQHQPHLAGRAAVAAVLTARVSPRLFDAGQMERLIVASGGNLRDLFSMVRQAALTARQRDGETISESDATHVINQTRVTYQRRLGESPIDPDKVSFKEKAESLEAIYFRDPDSDSPDAVLHSLLRARAVQEFNGERWFGVHPLVVDILRRRPGRFAKEAEEAVPKPKARAKKS